MKCPLCEGDVDVFYTAPLTYECRSCKTNLVDVNDRGIAVLSEEMARRKRPAMYGGPVCECCPHAPHPEGDCEFCKYGQREVRLAPRSTLNAADQARLKAIEEAELEQRREAAVAARDTDDRHYKD